MLLGHTAIECDVLSIPSSLPPKNIGQPLSSLVGDNQLLAAAYLHFLAFFLFPFLPYMLCSWLLYIFTLVLPSFFLSPLICYVPF